MLRGRYILIKHREEVSKLIEALLSVNRIEAAKILDECYSLKQDFSMLEEIVSGSLEKVGEGWEQGEISLSQVYMSGIICEELIDSYLPKSNVQKKYTPRIAIAVLKDHHALGKKIVSSIIKANGYNVLDFGQGVSVDGLVQLAWENNVDVLLISVLMLPSALKVKDVKEGLLNMGANTKIIVGGAPFRLDNTLWEKVGADAQGIGTTDIIEAIEKVVNSKND